MTYADNLNNPEGEWILFEDGHEEFWDITRIQAELAYRDLSIFQTQIRLLRNKINKLTKG